jgi:hypothetical protein
VAPRSSYSFRLRFGMSDLLFAIQVDRHTRAGFIPRVALPAAMFAVAFGAILSTSGCLFPKKQARVFVPPPPKRPNPAALKPPPILDPPDTNLEIEDTLNVAVIEPASIELPPPPAPPPPAPRRPTVASPKPAPAAPPAVETPAPPKVVQLFSPDQEREKNHELDDSLASVQRALDTLGRRNLTADQHDKMQQIQDFLTQAKQARQQDLVTAVNLAKRADVLAKDLLGHVP